MKKSACLALAAALAWAVAAPARAQEMRAGTWTGTMTPPGGQPIEVTFEVGGTPTAPTVAMSTPIIPDAIPFNDIQLQGSTLSFWWEPGIRVNCTLTRDPAGAYAGTCTDGRGAGDGGITMVPPA